VIEAIVLAGGEGRRLRSVVHDLPKPMADIAGRPFLWWLLTRLSQQRTGRVILSVGYKAETIQDYFGNAFSGMEITYSVETESLGTGGAIKLALAHATELGVIVMNGDTYTDVDMWHLLGTWESHMGIRVPHHSDLAMAVTHLDDISRYGAVVVDKKTNRVVGFEEKQGSAAGYINAGTYCLRRDLFLKYPAPDKFSFERDFLPKHLAELNPVAFTAVRGFIDIGVPEDYALAQRVIPQLAAEDRSKELESRS
jgi:D-glycero-alpha-D-manno-heptose 1-phosphate guanylyltransferase